MLLPAILPDEIFASLLARMGRINGYADLRDMASIYFGDGPLASFVDAEIDISRFARQTDYAYLGADRILQALTWYSHQARLGEIAKQRIDGLAKGSVRFSLGASMFPGSAVLGYCPSCRLHDYQHYGMTYWHRLHQLPIVLFCPIHSDRVVKVRVKRCTLHKEFPLPGDFESPLDISAPMSDMSARFWRGVAVMASEILNGDDVPDAELIFSVLAEELHRKKFVSPRSGVCLSAFIEALATKAFENSYDTLSRETLAFLRGIARSLDRHEGGMAFGRVVLLYWLFGGWRAVHERCRWYSVFGSASHLAVRKAVTETSSLEAKYRRVCSAFIREHPECARLDFMRAEYRSFKWLLHNDKIWLDRQLPIPTRAGRQLVLY